LRPSASAIGSFFRRTAWDARALQAVSKDNAEFFVSHAVSENVDLIATDESPIYLGLNNKSFKHEAVPHSSGEYVRGVVHTQTIDGFWSLLKRGIMGTFHHVCAKYLPLYVAEFEFRYDNRNNPNIFGASVARC
jgi:hypothetical protein